MSFSLLRKRRYLLCKENYNQRIVIKIRGVPAGHPSVCFAKKRVVVGYISLSKNISVGKWSE